MNPATIQTIVVTLLAMVAILTLGVVVVRAHFADLPGLRASRDEQGSDRAGEDAPARPADRVR